MAPEQDRYSTLEVDEEANRHATQEEKIQSPYPASSTGLSTLPEVIDTNNHPEVVTPHPDGNAAAPLSEKHTICGLRRKVFWIIVAVVSVVVVGAAVGGGVRGALASKGSSDEGASSVTANNGTEANVFMPNTKLAALNYTDNNVDHHRVFFQATSGAIYQTAWNSSGRTWTVSSIELEDATSQSELFRIPTPISAAHYHEDCGGTSTTFYLYFIDSNERFRQLRSADPDQPWSFGPADNQVVVPNDTQITSYGCTFKGEMNNALAFFQDSDRWMQKVTGEHGDKVRVDSTQADDIQIISPDQNSSMAIVPHYTFNVTKRPYISVFFLSRGNMQELHYNNQKFDFTKEFPSPKYPTISDIANIAGFSYGYNTAKDQIMGMQLLYTTPDQRSGGVTILSNLNSAADWDVLNPTELSNPFSKVLSYSAIAASQAGRVYAVVDEGSGLELTEWEYVPSNDSYVTIGTVNNQIP